MRRLNRAERAFNIQHASLLPAKNSAGPLAGGRPAPSLTLLE